MTTTSSANLQPSNYETELGSFPQSGFGGHHQRQRSFSAPNPIAPEHNWASLASPEMVIPPFMESPRMSGTNWTFPVTALQTPSRTAGGSYQSLAILQSQEGGRLVRTFRKHREQGLVRCMVDLEVGLGWRKWMRSDEEMRK